MADLDGQLRRAGDGLQKAPLLQDHVRPPRPIPIGELGRGSHEDAPARQGRIRGPAPPVLEERAHPRQAARMLERRPHDLVDEAFGSDPQHLELQLFLRIEMGEETTLGEPELACQGCQAEPVEPFARGQPEGGVEDAVARLGTFRHGNQYDRSCGNATKRTTERSGERSGTQYATPVPNSELACGVAYCVPTSRNFRG